MAVQDFTAPAQGTDNKMKIQSIVNATDTGDYPNGQGSSSVSEQWSFARLDIMPSGRPIRANRGNTAQRLPGFLDSSTLVVDSSDGDDEYASAQTHYSDLDNNGQIMHTRASPELGTVHAPSTPPFSPLPPAIAPLLPPPPSPTWKEVSYQTHSNPFDGYLPGASTARPLRLSVSVPKGFSGQVLLTIDRESMRQTERLLLAPGIEDQAKPLAGAGMMQAKSAMEPLDLCVQLPYNIRHAHMYADINFDGIVKRTPQYIQKEVEKQFKELKKREPIVPKPFTIPIPPKRSFLDLSGEIRNRIYRLILRGEAIQFINGMNFERSGSILRTNKQIYEESRRVLYGENEFIFERDRQKCGVFWKPDRSEIGYTNVRRFLEMIGPVNIGLIRLVGFAFEDATPSSAPGKSLDDRRYANDLHCFQMLKTFAKYGNLHKVTIGLYGRRILCEWKDLHFVRALKSIPADLVEFKHPRLCAEPRLKHMSQRVRESLEKTIREGMQKAKKARADAEVATKKAVKEAAIEAAKKAAKKAAAKQE